MSSTDSEKTAIFGSNIKMCLRLLGRNAESLATKADIPLHLVERYIEGSQAFREDDIQAISHEIGLVSRILLDDHGSDQELNLRQAFRNAGVELPEEDDDPPKADDEVEEASEDDGSSPSSQEEEEPSSEEDSETHAEDPVWEDEFSASLGGQTFNLLEKEMRARVMGHLRAAKGDLTYKFLAEGTDKSSGWFSSVERGLSRINRSDLEDLAKKCDTTVGVLLTGRGLDKSLMAPQSRGGGKKSGSAPTFSLPFISDEDTNDFFRRRCLSRKVEPADGVPFQELLVVARKDGQEEVDWQRVWLTLTKEGAEIAAYVDKFAKNMRGWNPALRRLALERIFASLEDSSEEE